MGKRPKNLRIVDGGKPNHIERGALPLPGSRSVPLPLVALKDLVETAREDPNFNLEDGLTQLLFKYGKGLPVENEDKTFYQSSIIGITQHENKLNVVYYGAHFIYPEQEPSKRGIRNYPSHARILSTLLRNRPDIEFIGGTLEWYEIVDLNTNELHVFYRIPCVVYEGEP